MTTSDLILRIEKSPKYPNFVEFLQRYETENIFLMEIYFRNLNFDFQWGAFLRYITQYCVLESKYSMNKHKILYRLYVGGEKIWIEDIESLEDIVIAFFEN